MEIARTSTGMQGNGGDTVIALHCSGAGGGMWRALKDQLGSDACLLAPDLYGSVDGPIWPGERAFSLDDEAAPIIALIDAQERPVHLVGHSYGGAVALYAAVARPDRLASLTLYEPVAFHLLKAADGIEYAEILWLAKDVEALLARGDRRGAMRRFVNYWGGRGSWDALAPDAQAALMRWAPKAPLDFHALLDRSALPLVYEQLGMPCQVIVGAQSPAPTREIANILCATLSDCDLCILDGIGHMGPITHAGAVARTIAGHLQPLMQAAIVKASPPHRESGCAA